MSRFSDTLLDHARYPRNFGRDVEANYVGQANLAGGPPVIEMYVRVEGEVVTHATFQASGCGVAVAVASVMTELLTGQSIVHCQHLTADDIATALEGIPGDKKFCADIAVAAFRNALCDNGQRTRITLTGLSR